ncbi:RNA-metabolising metallo-beta-lactamase [Salinisphaera sp. S4-8]|uniref:MBL fold metallo-hydrolase n=1 Tax=Salinisphaera sp. S4-8 TaxID=633357 RepID=UPI0033427A0B
MEIQFLGPLGKVTGSCAWMRDTARNWSFLVDCGIQQSEATAKSWNAGDHWPFEPSDLKFVLLTHAHVDHCGLIPELYKRGFSGTVYCTKETEELATLLLKDAASFPDTPYALEDVDRVRWHTPNGDTRFGAYHPVDDDLFIRFFPSGHIIGSTSITVLWGPPGGDQRSIVFSGDIGPGSKDHEVLPFLRPRQHPAPADFAVLESTYGDKNRCVEQRSPEARRNRLRALLDRVLESNGTAAITAFAVGRTQDIMFDLHHIVANAPDQYGAIDFVLDSPSALAVNDITLRALRKTQTVQHTGKTFSSWLGKQVFRELELDHKNPDDVRSALAICEMALGTDRLAAKKILAGNAVARAWRPLFRVAEDRNEEIRQTGNRPRVVLMTSGMGDGGPAAHWLPSLARHPRNLIAPSGYCAPSSACGKFLEVMNSSPGDRALRNDEIHWAQPNGGHVASLPVSEIKAEVQRLDGYSAHGDQSDLVNWLFHTFKEETDQVMAPTVFLQHGEDRQRRALEDALLRRADDWGLNVDILRPHDPDVWHDLEHAANTTVGREERDRIRRQIQALENQLSTM